MGYDDHLERALEETPDIEEGGERFQVPDPEEIGRASCRERV